VQDVGHCRSSAGSKRDLSTSHPTAKPQLEQRELPVFVQRRPRSPRLMLEELRLDVG
jgi:hypothetical protein